MPARRYPREVKLEELEPGDLVAVHWLDASEGRAVPPLRHKLFDTPVISYGIFLGIRGIRTRHIIVVKEYVMDEIHYNSIPLGMLEKIEKLGPYRVKAKWLKKLVKAVEAAARSGRNGRVPKEAKKAYRAIAENDGATEYVIVEGPSVLFDGRRWWTVVPRPQARLAHETGVITEILLAEWGGMLERVG